MALKDYLNKEYNHDDLVRVRVVGVVPKSRTKVVVQVIDRGKGWNEKLQRYTGVKNSVGWYLGENKQFGHIDEVHVKTLKQ